MIAYERCNEPLPLVKMPLNFGTKKDQRAKLPHYINDVEES